MKTQLLTCLKAALLAAAVAGSATEAAAQCMRIGTNLATQSPWEPDGAKAFKDGLADGQGEEWANTSNPWDAAFLQEISSAPYTVLRFMDWGVTNFCPLEKWEDRLRAEANNYEAGYYRSGKNVAYRWMVDLCNRTEKDLWINVPHRANDTYVRELARLIKKQLEPGRKVYVEYSNETWNTAFAQGNGNEGQYTYCVREGKRLGLPGYDDLRKGQSFYVYRAVRVFKIFQDVFSQAPARGSLEKVLAFSGDEGVATDALKQLDNPQVNPDGIRPTVFAVAPYIKLADVASAGALQRFKNAVDALYEAPRPGFAGGYMTKFKNVLAAFHRTHSYRLRFVAYEGGDESFNSTSAGFARNPEAYDAYTYMLHKIKPDLEMFVHFVHASKWSGTEAWGAKEYYGQPDAKAPKYRALRDFANAMCKAPAAQTSSALPATAAAAGALGLAVHPNPAQHAFTVLLPTSGPATIEVLDVAGRVVAAQATPGQGEQAVDVRRLAPGFYTVRVTQGATVTTERLELTN